MNSRLRSEKWDHSLSLSMIVKNEATTLEKCLRLARPYVDEIVVVDTGSTDGTQEIAKRYADVYDEIEWPDSFSKARNYSMDKATGDFILILDGDEYIEEPEAWKRIHTVLGPDVAAVQVPVKNLLREGTLIESDRAYSERVFANDPSLRYEGRIHNQIVNALNGYLRRTGKVVRQVPAEVTHVGYTYDEEGMKQKYRPRIRLLEDEYRERPTGKMRSYYGFQLGVMYFTTQEHQKAFDVLQTLDYSKLIPINAFYGRLIAMQAAMRVKRPRVALQHTEAMLSLSRVEPIAFYAAGIALVELGRVHDGILMLLEAYVVNAAVADERRFQMNARSLIRFLTVAFQKLNLTKHKEIFENILAEGDVESEATLDVIMSVRDNVARVAARKDRAAA